MPRRLSNQKKSSFHPDWMALLISGGFLVFLLFVPSVKIFFVLSFIYFGLLVIECGFAKAVIYSMPILSHINFGQQHRLLAIPPDAIVSPQYLEGRHLFWSISPWLVITFIAALLFWKWQKSQSRSIRLHLPEKVLLIVISSGFLSALYGAIFPGLSIYAIFSSLLGIIWIFYLISLGRNYSHKQWKRVLLTLSLTMILLMFYESLIVFGQILLKGTIGVFIEGTQIAPVFGLGADETSGSFRPFGLSAHPNGLASHQLLWLITVNFFYFYLDLKEAYLNKTMVWINLISLVVIILTLSRAAYLALGIIIVFFWFRHPQRIRRLQQIINKQLKQIKPRHIIVLIALSGTLIFRFTNRLLSSIYSLSESGGVTTRLVQYQEAWRVFLHSPFWGVGSKMFIPTSYQLFPNGVMAYFPENVHNGFLLMLIERGVLGFTLQLIFLVIFFKSISKSPLSKINRTLLYSGVIAGSTIMFFHPEKKIFSIIVLIGIIILNYENKKRYPQ